jgi:hypothetical protein
MVLDPVSSVAQERLTGCHCVWLWLSRGTGKRSAICGGSPLPVPVVNDAITEIVLTAVIWYPWGMIVAHA